MYVWKRVLIDLGPSNPLESWKNSQKTDPFHDSLLRLFTHKECNFLGMYLKAEPHGDGFKAPLSGRAEQIWKFSKWLSFFFSLCVQKCCQVPETNDRELSKICSRLWVWAPSKHQWGSVRSECCEAHHQKCPKCSWRKGSCLCSGKRSGLENSWSQSALPWSAPEPHNIALIVHLN